MAMRLGGEFRHGRAKKFSQNAEINVTPFVDIMLVLLIIFMVAAPLATVSVKVDLPPPTESPPEQKELSLFVSLQKTKQIFVADSFNPGDEIETTLGGLNEVLLTKSGNNKQVRVFIRADQDVVYNDLIELMNQVQRAGYVRVGLVAEEVVE